MKWSGSLQAAALISQLTGRLRWNGRTGGPGRGLAVKLDDPSQMLVAKSGLER